MSRYPLIPKVGGVQARGRPTPALVFISIKFFIYITTLHLCFNKSLETGEVAEVILPIFFIIRLVLTALLLVMALG
jgi:hypothetical protein